ncbi:transglutaminase family protein [Arsenicitalea aurantiaca]|uniref:Transglutaminase family protein n=1 Tax=Arsenicitalea aurantiaca TaxID=1783274 RepID=A0A433XB04_9HYPH|nr:transglutaminase family protein [Arsenicitalea aurantiaca]RUT31243.1 transglutaminase family protein [Arsenicitalea aurantiaca]
MKIEIRHHLRVAIGPDLTRAIEHLLLTPQSGTTQTVDAWSIEMPGFAEAARFKDAYGNVAHLVCQTHPEPELSVLVAGSVETHDTHGVVGKPDGAPVPTLYKRQTALTRSPVTVHGKFRHAERSGQARIPLLHQIMERVGELYRFGLAEDDAPEAEGPSQSQTMGTMTQSQTMGTPARPEGKAEDFAHAFIGAARALDIPARFVTGYLAAEDDRPAVFHAWAEAWDDALGWIGFDAALGLCPAERHVRVAVGLDAATCPPIRTVPATGAPEVLALSVTPA